MVSEILVNFGSVNGLVPDGTKPLPEPMLTYHEWDPLDFISGRYRSGHETASVLLPGFAINW